MGKKTLKKVQEGTRPQRDRTLRILQRIQKGDYPSRKVLAEELEVDQRTIQRDLNFMRDCEHLPIEYDPNKYGYFLTEPVANFPLLQISEGELISVFIAQKALAQYQGTPFEAPMKAAFEKLVSSLKGDISVAWSDLEAAISFKSIEVTPADLSIFKGLRLAIERCFEITFEYWKLNSTEFEKRRVRPLHLICSNSQWYLISHDLDRNAKRKFVLSRMRALEVSKTRFVKEKGFSVQKYLQGSFGIFSGDESIEVKIWFDGFASRLVKERNWHFSQNIRELRNGEIELTLILTSTVEIIPWILSWGVHARVLSPIKIIESVREIVCSVEKSYLAAQSDPVSSA